MNIDVLENIDVEDYKDPILDEENLEVDYDYLELCLDEAGQIIARYGKAPD